MLFDIRLSENGEARNFAVTLDPKFKISYIRFSLTSIY